MVKTKAFGTTFHEGETNRFGFPKVGMEIKEFRAKGSSASDTACPTPDQTGINMLIQNFWGAINPTFCNVVSGMIRRQLPAIMIITETKVSADRAKEIIDRHPLDGVIITNSIGLYGGLWVLWDFVQVELAELSSTEQEIHALVSSTAKLPWLLFAVYASPRFAKQRLLWDNLAMVAGLHSLS